jgi:tetratricopeptide (TPR) repeat protein
MGRVDEAIADLSRASFALPGIPDVLYHLGKAYMKKDRYDDAIVVLERAVKISPKYLEAEQALKEAVEKLPPKSPVSEPDAEPPTTSAKPGPPTESRPLGNNLPAPNP